MKYVFPIFIAGLLVSCFNEGDCLVTATNYMRVQFKKRKSTSTDTLITFAYRSVDVVGQNASLIIRPAQSNILLPLDINQASTSTTFVFHRINADSTIQATDTIQVGYVAQARIVGKDCGVYTYYQNLKILKTTLDSTQIKSINTGLAKDPSTLTYALNYQIFY